MADNRQFGSPKAPQFGDRISPGGSNSGESQDCIECEAMLTDALDGTLSPGEQALFDAHMARCGPCSQMFADASRGAAWLEMLRDPRPEPPTALLERILLQTSGARVRTINADASATLPQIAGVSAASCPTLGFPALTPGYSPADHAATGTATFAKVIPFRSRFKSAIRSSALGQVMLQPRLAMTAAMAFFSIALTMDLTGVRLRDLRASDLRPGSIKRDFYSANARVVQYYEGLRVVYELESRVHDLQSASDTDVPAAASDTPDSSVQSAPASQPSPPKQPPQPIRKQPTPNPGTSRREGLNQSRRLLAAASPDLPTASPEKAQA